VGNLLAMSFKLCERVALQARDLSLSARDDLLVALGCRQSQQVVERCYSRPDLFINVLRGAHKLGERGVLGGDTFRRCLQLTLHRLPAQHVGIPKCVLDVAETIDGLRLSSRK
jgi:hypothetical protein